MEIFSQIPTLKVKTYNRGKYSIKTIEGAINLPTWKGFQSRQGAYNGMDKTGASDGIMKLIVDGNTEADQTAVSKDQVNAYQFIISNQERIKEHILNALLIKYKELQQQYGYGEDDESFMPQVTEIVQFQSLIGLSIVHLLDLSKDGMAYVGYEFGCTWDEEHGLGFMTHGDRVIEIGAADTSFDTWIAENDIDPVRAAQELEKYRDVPKMAPKKPWWKFW
jgi:hypothetical protein